MSHRRFILAAEGRPLFAAFVNTEDPKKVNPEAGVRLGTRSDVSVGEETKRDAAVTSRLVVMKPC